MRVVARAQMSAALLLGLATAGPVAAQQFNQFVVFGDSTVDSGFYRTFTNPGGGGFSNAQWAAAVAAGAGKPTTSPGLMSSEALAALFGLAAAPSNQGGTNFATSGAKSVDPNGPGNGGFTAAVPVATQIGNYLAGNGGHANNGALYLISAGANDVSFATGDSGSGPFPVNQAAYLTTAASGLATAVARLHAAGAQFIVVRGLNYSFGDAATQADRLLYTQALWSDLHAAGVNFIPSDGNAMRRAVAAFPAAFGFQFADTAHPACTQPGGVTTAWALLCSSAPGAPSTLVTPDADRTRLFADDQHFTTAGQKIIADYEYSLVVAPSEISYLAEVPVKTRAGIVNAIRNQLPLSFDQAAKFHAWVTGDLSWLKMSNTTGFPDDPGTPVAITAGFDYRLTPEWLVGGAISAGVTRQTFSLGGDFKDDELAVSLYGAYRNAPYWFNAVASAGAMHYDINRQVPIGITVQPNTGSTWGSNISFAAEAGYDFRSALGVAPSGMPVKAPAASTVVTHGPVIGIVLQRVSVNGFTEADQFAAIGGFTALSFDRQIRNSAVGELGYQASVDVGKWQPFAKAVWNHEFADPDRLVTASLTTVAAPSFSLPAVQLGTDWATGIAGTRLKIGDGMSAFAAVVSAFAQHRVTNFGGQIGINVALQ